MANLKFCFAKKICIPLFHCSLVLLLPCFVVFVSLLLVSFLAYPCCFIAPLFHYSTFNYFPYLDWYFPFPDLSCKCLSSSFETWNSIQLVSFFLQFFSFYCFFQKNSFFCFWFASCFFKKSLCFSKTFLFLVHLVFYNSSFFAHFLI